MIFIVTIRDIAKRAGVSVATVSHVINNTRFVSEELRQKVQKVMEELDYHPNLVAGSLRKKKTSTIGLIVPDNSNPVFADLSRAIEDIGFSLGYSVILCNSAYNLDKEIKYIRVLRSKRVDGLIIIPTTIEAIYINQLVDAGLPVVIVDRTISDAKTDSVLLDNYHGVYDATKYLINLGHKIIAYIDRPFDLPHSLDRLRGHRKALEENGIKFREELVVRGGFNYEGGAEAMQKLLMRKSIPTAVIAFNDISAIGAIRAIKDNGLEVPRDISVIGFDDIPQSSFVVPRLTTVHFPKYKMAEAAFDLLKKKLEGTSTDQRAEIVLPLRLVVRESTAKVG